MRNCAFSHEGFKYLSCRYSCRQLGQVVSWYSVLRWVWSVGGSYSRQLGGLSVGNLSHWVLAIIMIGSWVEDFTFWAHGCLLGEDVLWSEGSNLPLTGPWFGQSSPRLKGPRGHHSAYAGKPKSFSWFLYTTCPRYLASSELLHFSKFYFFNQHLIHQAAINGHAKIVNLLLDDGADPNLRYSITFSSIPFPGSHTPDVL